MEPTFLARFHGFLLQLVPRLAVGTNDRGRGLADGLGRSVLWAALTTDSPEVVEATLQNVGGEYSRQGFPDDGYHGAGHALLRAARDSFGGDWTSELSSGWVAFYGWLGMHLQEGARQARRLAAPPVTAAPSVTAAGRVPIGGSMPLGGQVPREIDLRDPATPPPSFGPAGTGPAGFGQAGTGPVGFGLAGTGPAGFGPDAERSGPNAVRAATATATLVAARPAPVAPQPSGDHLGQPRPERAREPRRDPPPGFRPEPEPDPRGNVPGSLEEVLGQLRSRYFTGNERALGAILTRVALRTGADLRTPRPDQRANPAVIANVMAVLQVMGYVIQPSFDGVGALVRPPHSTHRPGRWWRRAVPGMFR
jgi:hypothetical protein